MKFNIKGKAVKCSREYVRAWLHASACVLAYHNKLLPDPIEVQLVEGFDHFGQWVESKKRIILRAEMSPEEMATTILHEVIHAACGHFGDNTDEKCCSTLTARLKPEVHALAKPLCDGTYKRAGFIAHTKLSYRTDEDHYDTDEDRPIGVKDRFSRKTA